MNRSTEAKTKKSISERICAEWDELELTVAGTREAVVALEFNLLFRHLEISSNPGRAGGCYRGNKMKDR